MSRESDGDRAGEPLRSVPSGRTDGPGSGSARETCAHAEAPSHAVDLAGLVTDDVPHPSPVHPPRGGTAAARPAPTGERALGIPGRHGDRKHHRRQHYRVRPSVRPPRGGGNRTWTVPGGIVSSGRAAAPGGHPPPPVGDRRLGSRPVTSDSPTSTASAPSFAYAIRSCGPRTPDSAILTIPRGSRVRPARTWSGRPPESSGCALDTDDLGAGVHRPLHLVLVVHLDQRRESDGLRALDEGLEAAWSRAATISRARSAP